MFESFVHAILNQTQSHVHSQIHKQQKQKSGAYLAPRMMMAADNRMGKIIFMMFYFLLLCFSFSSLLCACRWVYDDGENLPDALFVRLWFHSRVKETFSLNAREGEKRCKFVALLPAVRHLSLFTAERVSSSSSYLYLYI